VASAICLKIRPNASRVCCSTAEAHGNHTLKGRYVRPHGRMKGEFACFVRGERVRALSNPVSVPANRG
jgi:hypothetical protein